MEKEFFISMLVNDMRDIVVEELKVKVDLEGNKLSFNYNDNVFTFKVNFYEEEITIETNDKIWSCDSIYDAIEWVKTFNNAE